LLAAFQGVVRGQDQELVYPVGTCFGVGSEGLGGAVVPCSGIHSSEITGTSRIAYQVDQLPQSGAEWEELVGPECGSLATQYAGGSLPADMQSGSLPLEQESWDAGERLVQCTIGWFGPAGRPTTESGSLHA
jgi:hypothetical protein